MGNALKMAETGIGALRRIGLMLVVATFGLIVMVEDAQAQNPFGVAVRIDDAVITNYEIQQRILFLQVLNAQGDLRDQAIEALINERLQDLEGQRLGAVASADAIEAGLTEFATRANLGPEQFLRQMQSEGIAPETVRDFIANGITWRNVVRARFGRAAQVTEEEVDRELELGTQLGGGREVLLAEIIIPLTPQNEGNLESELGRLGRDLNGNTELFSEAASRFSAAPTRENGGLTGWRPLGALPPGLQDLFLTMGVGQVTSPISLNGQAFALFQMRGRREVPTPPPVITEIEYATIAIPGGRSAEALGEAARIHAAVDTCLDLNGVIPGGFELVTSAPGSIPQDISVALAGLDDNEMSTQVTRNSGAVLLAVMLCDRVVADPDGGREAVLQRLTAQRLERYAASYLEELRAEATITFGTN